MLLAFLKSNWIEVGSATVGLISAIAGLLAHSSAKRKSKVDVDLTITEAHQALWGKFLENPSLLRVTADKADLKSTPVTPEEETFVLLLLTHLSSTLSAIEKGTHTEPEGMKADVANFYSKPVPRSIASRHFGAQPKAVQELLKGIVK
jgi:hypothetical protein